ncbi:MAG: hypothetical protein KDJ27_06735 [Gammaproteobacteria bacterium]|nr:hypothetical protein [Gammaproteobacteria bacterium]
MAGKPRIIDIPCEPRQAVAVAAALRAYVDAAYPRGGSECAQVAREALLDTAGRIAAHAGGALPLRRRMLPQLRAALTWTLSEQGPAALEWQTDLEAVLEEIQ